MGAAQKCATLKSQPTRTSASLVKLNSTDMKHRLLSIELGTEQTETEKVEPARKFKFTTAARAQS